MGFATALQITLLAAQTIVLAMTGYFVWRYTKATERYTHETAGLRAESVRQNKLLLRPIVLPLFYRENTLGFWLKNCGQGCAVNVGVSPVSTRRYAEGEMSFGEIETRFGTLDYLPSEAVELVAYSTYADGQSVTGTPFLHWFHPSEPGEEIRLLIIFEDIEGRQYEIPARILAEMDLARLPRKVEVGKIREVDGTSRHSQ